MIPIHEQNTLQNRQNSTPFAISKSVPNVDVKMLHQAALQSFFNLTEKWNLNTEQQRILLGQLPKTTFHRLKKNQQGVLSFDTLERISYLLGIHKALCMLLADVESAYQWIHKPNSHLLFHGKPALDKMLKGSLIDLADIRRFLDSERGF